MVYLIHYLVCSNSNYAPSEHKPKSRRGKPGLTPQQVVLATACQISPILREPGRPISIHRTMMLIVVKVILQRVFSASHLIFRVGRIARSDPAETRLPSPKTVDSNHPETER
jgi:hypothetical protein